MITGNTKQRIAVLLVVVLDGCNQPRVELANRPDIAPTATRSGPSLRLDSSQIKPIETTVMPIDLLTVKRVAAAENIDIQQAIRRVEASLGRLQSTQGAVFPVLAPTASFEHVDGTVRAVQGDLTGVGFDTFQLYATLQTVLNPGRVVYEIIAARKRLSASEHDERAVVLETLRAASNEYYELVLGRSRVAAAQQSLLEAEELVRISHLRVITGVGLRADELRAEAELASRQQDVALRLYEFYNASIALTVTLHLDSTITLSPAADVVPTVTLVREDLSLDVLLGLALEHRPDLASIRELVGAASADRKAAWWAALGAQFQVGYQYGGITGHADNVVQRPSIPSNLVFNPFSDDGSFSSDPFVNNLIKNRIADNSKQRAGFGDKTFVISDQERFNATAAWHFSISAVGDLKSAGAAEQSVALELERRIDQVRALVVRERQASRTHAELIPRADQQVAAADEALRLTRSNLEAGTMTTLDVLQAEDAAAQARVRYAEAIVRYNQSQSNLAAALGLLE